MRTANEPRTRSELAAIIDHTLLHPESTEPDVRSLCNEARELMVHAVCVSATMVTVAADELADSDIHLAAVIGFPSGAHRAEVKALEAERAFADGAQELDVVLNLGLVRVGEWRAVREDIGAVRAAAPAATLKVILEAGVLRQPELIAACQASDDAGAQYVKTSTGFHAAGGATPDQVRTMVEATDGRLGVKALGGIRTAEAALSLVRAGATRLGLSATRSVLGEMTEVTRLGPP
jgi:deoxyribose-phosphate aldolase